MRVETMLEHHVETAKADRERASEERQDMADKQSSMDKRLTELHETLILGKGVAKGVQISSRIGYAVIGVLVAAISGAVAWFKTQLLGVPPS